METVQFVLPLSQDRTSFQEERVFPIKDLGFQVLFFSIKTNSSVRCLFFSTREMKLDVNIYSDSDLFVRNVSRRIILLYSNYVLVHLIEFDISISN